MANVPSIGIVSMWYNEGFLAPYFLKHYSFADHIRIIDDTDTTDGTREIVSQYPNTSYELITFPEGFDNDIAVDKLNRCYAESKYDWVIAVDCDEFVIEPKLREVLVNTLSNIFYVRLYQVYRHKEDKDLDLSIPIAEQRRHGDINAVKGRNRAGKKPIVVHTGLTNMKWMPGQHNIWNRYKYITDERVLLGSHWIMADPCFAVERRMRGKSRQSPQNIARGNSSHYNTITEEKVRKELAEHTNDLPLF